MLGEKVKAVCIPLFRAAFWHAVRSLVFAMVAVALIFWVDNGLIIAHIGFLPPLLGSALVYALRFYRQLIDDLERGRLGGTEGEWVLQFWGPGTIVDANGFERNLRGIFHQTQVRKSPRTSDPQFVMMRPEEKPFEIKTRLLAS